jgi:CheY-like chemotaxis protein
MDPAQIDQILTNLAVNARDAIPDHGKVTIQTANTVIGQEFAKAHECAAGDYVVLSVSDTGQGLSPEAQEHLFEPFFTTKGVGKGTGLGLAMIFGIVKQNRGLIQVENEPGKGATFKITLPRAAGLAAVTQSASAALLPPGTETLLLVEDEGQILDLGQSVLQQCGYTVLSAATPEIALALAARHPGRIDLLITDVVMPAMNGRELRQRLTDSRPGLACLFISGYSADVLGREGVLEASVHFLQKPFTLQGLAQKVRDILDRPGDVI